MKIVKFMKRDKYLLLMSLPGLLLLVLFKYVPMYGVLVAFQDYTVMEGISGSRWVGFKHFANFLQDPYAWEIFSNTVMLNVYSLVFGFFAPVILALSFNELRLHRFKSVAQTISYLPHFISIVIVIGLIKEFTVLDTGKINELIAWFGGAKIDFLAKPFWFVVIYVASGIWQTAGFGSIIYLAALSGINPELYESSAIDGANRMQRIWHINIPSLVPIICVLLILAMGGMLNSDFQKILLLYNELTYSVADVLSTYLYRAGILGASYSYATAVGIFLSLISFLFVYLTNAITKRLSENSLW